MNATRLSVRLVFFLSAALHLTPARSGEVVAKPGTYFPRELLSGLDAATREAVLEIVRSKEK